MKKIKVSINVSGGNIQSILSNNDNIELEIFDYDNAEVDNNVKKLELKEAKFNKDLKTIY